MLDNISPENLLFLDIETVPQYRSYDEMPDHLKALWAKKAAFIQKEENEPEEVFPRAGIYAEFGKIVCISAGLIFRQDGSEFIRLKSFAGDDEKKILDDFRELLVKYSKTKDFSLCAHNGKEFDFPYIARRMLINGIVLPPVLDIAGKKPWEIRHVDTMELWKFGDYKNYTSLDLLTAVFNIPSPKDDIDGSMVADVYWNDKDIQRIVKYCEKDVVSIIQLIRRFKGMAIIAPGFIQNMS